MEQTPEWTFALLAMRSPVRESSLQTKYNCTYYTHVRSHSRLTVGLLFSVGLWNLSCFVWPFLEWKPGSFILRSENFIGAVLYDNGCCLRAPRHGYIDTVSELLTQLWNHSFCTSGSFLAFSCTLSFSKVLRRSTNSLFQRCIWNIYNMHLSLKHPGSTSGM